MKLLGDVARAEHLERQLRVRHEAELHERVDVDDRARVEILLEVADIRDPVVGAEACVGESALREATRERRGAAGVGRTADPTRAALRALVTAGRGAAVAAGFAAAHALALLVRADLGGDVMDHHGLALRDCRRAAGVSFVVFDSVFDFSVADEETARLTRSGQERPTQRERRHRHPRDRDADHRDHAGHRDHRDDSPRRRCSSERPSSRRSSRWA